MLFPADRGEPRRSRARINDRLLQAALHKNHLADEHNTVFAADLNAFTAIEAHTEMPVQTVLSNQHDTRNMQLLPDISRAVQGK